MSGYVVPGESTGIKQEIPGKFFREELLTPAVPGDHVWVAIAQYVVSAEVLRAGTKTGGGAPLHLDKENLAAIVIGCYICEQSFSTWLSHRKCPGEPRPGELR